MTHVIYPRATIHIREPETTVCGAGKASTTGRRLSGKKAGARARIDQTETREQPRYVRPARDPSAD